MLKSKRNFRLGACGAVLGAVYLGLAGSAMAWNEPLWVRQLGTETYDAAYGVATDAAGNVYLTGETDGSLDGANRGDRDVWVAKYDAAGHALWKRQLGTADIDIAYGVATDAAGNVYLTGETDGSLGGANLGPYDAWVAKYDAAGRVLWMRQLGTETYDDAYGVATDAAGNVYLTGWTDGSLGGANRGGTRCLGGEVRRRRPCAVEAATRNGGLRLRFRRGDRRRGQRLPDRIDRWLARRRQSRRRRCLGGEVRRRRPCAVEAATRNGGVTTTLPAWRPTPRATST